MAARHNILNVSGDLFKSEDEFRKLRKDVQDSIKRNYPNPNREGCPRREVLKALAAGNLPQHHPAASHVAQCGPCLEELQIYWSGKPSRRTVALSVAALALAVLAAVGTVSLIRQHRQLEAEVGELRSERAEHQRQIENLQSRLESQTVQPGEARQTAKPADAAKATPTLVASLLLKPGRLRGGATDETYRLSVPSRPSFVLLLLEVERASYLAYDVLVQTPDGREVQRINGLRSQSVRNGGSVIPVSLSSQVLRVGNYIIKLYGRSGTQKPQILDAYPFLVDK
jgi:hypothetical protein